MTDFCGIELAHPVINGSGTFDAIAALRAFGDASSSASPSAPSSPRPSPSAPRRQSAAAPVGAGRGLINSIGLPNKGLRRLPRAGPARAWPSCRCPLIVNVMGFDPRGGGARSCARSPSPRWSRRSNSTCPAPTSRRGSTSAPTRPTEALIAHVRPLTTKPLIVKLTPNATDSAAVGRPRRATAGADAVSLINTLRGMPLLPTPASHGSAGRPAACPGRPSAPIALAQVAQVASARRRPDRRDGRRPDAAPTRST